MGACPQPEDLELTWPKKRPTIPATATAGPVTQGRNHPHFPSDTCSRVCPGTLHHTAVPHSGPLGPTCLPQGSSLRPCRPIPASPAPGWPGARRASTSLVQWPHGAERHGKLRLTSPLQILEAFRSVLTKSQNLWPEPVCTGCCQGYCPGLVLRRSAFHVFFPGFFPHFTGGASSPSLLRMGAGSSTFSHLEHEKLSSDSWGLGRQLGAPWHRSGPPCFQGFCGEERGHPNP